MIKNIRTITKDWLLGGGIIILLSGAVAYGINKQAAIERLKAGEAMDIAAVKAIADLESGRIANADNIMLIKIDLAEIKSDVKWIRKNSEHVERDPFSLAKKTPHQSSD